MIKTSGIGWTAAAAVQVYPFLRSPGTSSLPMSFSQRAWSSLKIPQGCLRSPGTSSYPRLDSPDRAAMIKTSGMIEVSRHVSMWVVFDIYNVTI